MKVQVDTSALTEACSLLSGQIARRRDLEVEGERRLFFSLLKQSLLDYELAMDVSQGINLQNPDAGLVGLDEVSRWFFADDFFEWVPLDCNAAAAGWYCRQLRDGPCSLAGIADALNLEIGWIRRQVRVWRNKRLAGGVDRLVPPQHDRGEADAA